MRNFRSQFTYLLAGPRVWQRVLISKFCNYFVNYSYILKYMLQLSRPRWSWGNVLASRSKVCGFKPGWGLWIFSRCKNCEHKSSGRDFKLGGPESEISGSLKNLKPEKIGLWAKFNRHIHVPVHWAGMTTPSKQYNTIHNTISEYYRLWSSSFMKKWNILFY